MVFWYNMHAWSFSSPHKPMRSAVFIFSFYRQGPQRLEIFSNSLQVPGQVKKEWGFALNHHAQTLRNGIGNSKCKLILSRLGVPILRRYKMSRCGADGEGSLITSTNILCLLS